MYIYISIWVSNLYIDMNVQHIYILILMSNIYVGVCECPACINIYIYR